MGAVAATTPVCSPALGATGGLLWFLYWLLETSRLPDISPAKMGLFRLNRELQLGVCHCGETRTILTWQGVENFYRKEIEGGRASKHGIHGFSLTDSLPGKKSSLSSSCCFLLSLKGMRASPSDIPTLFY